MLLWPQKNIYSAMKLPVENKNLTILKKIVLTEHHQAGLIIEGRVVGVDKGLLQLLMVDVAAVVGVNRLKPLIGLRVNSWWDIPCNTRII